MSIVWIILGVDALLLAGFVGLCWTLGRHVERREERVGWTTRHGG